MKALQKVILLNPFSVSLKKYPFMEVNKLIYKRGDYSIYKYADKHFVHTFKNIVIGERVAANKELINNLLNDIKPIGEGILYHDYNRPKRAILKGIKAAKKLNFKIK